MKLLFTSILFAALAFAQQPHSVKLTWVASIDQIPGMTYTVYKAQSDCSGTPAFSVLTAGITGLTYEDLAVTPKTYCYAVTANLAGMESVKSNTALAVVPLGAPTSLAVAAK